MRKKSNSHERITVQELPRILHEIFNKLPQISAQPDISPYNKTQNSLAFPRQVSMKQDSLENRHKYM